MTSVTFTPAHCHIWASDTADRPHADSLSEAISLPVSDAPSDYQLLYEDNRWTLKDCRAPKIKPLYFDFTAGKSEHRRQFGGGRSQTLAKAIGLKSGITPNVIDLTAGMGRDAFVLACLGCSVKLIERSPIVHTLLADALRRAQDYENTREIAQNMQLYRLSAWDYLSELKQTQPHELEHSVIYCDPMYPHREKSALVKKEMRMFRDIVGEDMDADQLLDAALAAEPARVVVKRPKGAPHLSNKKPSTTLESKNTRYDVYAFKKLIPNIKDAV